MTTTLSTLRGMLSKEVQSSRYVGLTTTSAGDAGGTTLLDTGLNSLPSGGDNDFCLGMYVLITELVTGGPAVGESQQVTAYVASTSTITTAAFSAQVKTGTNFELHRYDPTDMDTAINNAVELLYPHLHVPYRSVTLVVDDLLSNGSLDTFSTTFTGWTNIGTPTLAAETTRKVHGTGSASITASGATEGIEQNLFTAVNIKEVVGKTLHVRGWVFATVASAARLRVTFDGATYTNGAWQAGDAEWENDDTQYIDVAVPADATEMTVSCEVTDGNVAYFDLVRAWIDPVYTYTIPSSVAKGPYSVSIAQSLDEPSGLFSTITGYKVEEDSSGRYIVINDALPSGYVLKITGVGPLSTMSTDAGTTEVDAPRTQLVVARAAQWLFEQLAADSPGDGSEFYVSQARRYEQRTQQLLATPGMRMRTGGATRSVSWSYG